MLAIPSRLARMPQRRSHEPVRLLGRDLEPLQRRDQGGGRGDDYHYHAAPSCMIDSMANKRDAAILGWGFDGYPLYGSANPDGTPVGTLDRRTRPRSEVQPTPTGGSSVHQRDTGAGPGTS